MVINRISSYAHVEILTLPTFPPFFFQKLFDSWCVCVSYFVYFLTLKYILKFILLYLNGWVSQMTCQSIVGLCCTLKYNRYIFFCFTYMQQKLANRNLPSTSECMGPIQISDYHDSNALYYQTEIKDNLRQLGFCFIALLYYIYLKASTSLYCSKITATPFSPILDGP